MNKARIYGQKRSRAVKHDPSGYFLTIVDKRLGRMYSAQVRGRKVVIEMTETATGKKEAIGEFVNQGGYAARAYNAAHEIERLTGRKIADGVLL